MTFKLLRVILICLISVLSFSQSHGTIIRGVFSGEAYSVTDKTTYDGTRAFNYGENWSSTYSQNTRALTGTFRIDTDKAPNSSSSLTNLSSYNTYNNIGNHDWLSASITLDGFTMNFGGEPIATNSIPNSTRRITIDNGYEYPSDKWQAYTKDYAQWSEPLDSNYIHYLKNSELTYEVRNLAPTTLSSSDLNQELNFQAEVNLPNEIFHGLNNFNYKSSAFDGRVGERKYIEGTDIFANFIVDYMALSYEGTATLSTEIQDILTADEGALSAATNSENLSEAGEITATFTSVEESAVDLDDYVFEGFDFALPGNSLQLWDIDYSGALLSGESVELIFGFDPIGLSIEEVAALDIYHYEDDVWTALGGVVDEINHTITVYTSSFSPFALGASISVPEPMSLTIFTLGLIAIGRRRLHSQTSSNNH